MILTHCGFDPYFSLATNNMSSRLPCDRSIVTGGGVEHDKFDFLNKTF